MKNILKLVAVLAVVLSVSNVADAKTLSLGSTGSDVATLQTWLINNGYPIPLIEKGVASKGYFGVQTSEAVKVYQEDKGLDLTGVIDSESYGNTTKLGSVTGPDVYFRMFFGNGSTNGGYIATSSTASTYTTVDSDFSGTPSVVSWTPNVNTTISLSSTSTFPYVPKVGDVAKIYIKNASTTAAASMTFAAKDIGLDLQKNEDVADLALLGLDWAELTLIRQSTTKVTVIYNEFTEAD